MPLRYSGDLVIDVEYSQAGFYRTIIRERAGDRVLWTGNVRPSRGVGEPITGTSPDAYDAAARAALARAEENPHVAPRTEEDDRGYYKIRRAAPRSSRDRRYRRDPPKRPRFVPTEARSWDPRDVLAGAYRGRKFEGEETFLVHAVWMDSLDTDGDVIGTKTVCRRIHVDNLVGPGESHRHPVTCPICRERIERSGLPETLLAPERDRRRMRRTYGSSRRRDPPAPGEFERNAKRPVQPVVIYVKGDDLVVVFLLAKNRDGKNMVYRERSGRSFVYAEDVFTRRNGWRRVRSDDPEAREANRVLHHLIDDHGWRISAR